MCIRDRININHFEDPLKNERLLDLVGIRRREKVIRYRMPDDRKRSLGAGIIIRKILDENGLTESCLRYSDNEKPVVDGLFFNVSHAGDYVAVSYTHLDVYKRQVQDSCICFLWF